MPGECGKQFANLRLLYGYRMATPAKSSSSMGQEFAQRSDSAKRAASIGTCFSTIASWPFSAW